MTLKLLQNPSESAHTDSLQDNYVPSLGQLRIEGKADAERIREHEKTIGGSLALYKAARTALADAHRIDEVKSLRDKALAMASYAIMAKDTELSRFATEIRLRAERRLGELMAEQKATVGLNPGTRPSRKHGGSMTDPPSIPTLASQGIDKHLADRARKAAAMPDAQYEAKIARQVDLAECAASATRNAVNPRTGFSHEIEWYTPRIYVEAVREVLRQIDLDPASSATANRTVCAGRFFSLSDDGLTQAWFGKVFLNPPYVHPTIMQFMQKLVDEISAGRVTEAIAITANFTDTGWFHLAVTAADAICFTRGRIAFVDPTGNRKAPTHGSLVFYFGSNVARFAQVFSKFGTVVRLREVVAWAPPSRRVRRAKPHHAPCGRREHSAPAPDPAQPTKRGRGRRLQP